MPQNQSRKTQPSEIDQLLVDYSNRRLDEEADRQGVPREFVRRIAGAESTNRPDVINTRRRSSAGAIGKMQLMPGTARDLKVDPYDVDANIEGGVRYAKQQLNTFGGDQAKAAAAYNAGPGAVKKYGGVPPYKETQDYVKKVAGPEQGASEIDNLYNQFVGQQSKEAVAPPSTAAPTESPANPLSRAVTRNQRIASIVDALMKTGGDARAVSETTTRLQKLSNADLTKEVARLQKLFATTSPTATETAGAKAAEEKKRAEYYAQPLYKQVGQEIGGGLARIGEGAQRAANRLLRPALEAIGFKEEVARGRAGEEATGRSLADQEEIANSLRSKIVRGVTAGAGGAAIMAPIAMVGGAPAVTLATAAQQDWERDPAGALAATAGAPVSIYAGKAISPLAGRAASQFASRPAQKAAQVGIEGLAGAGANAGQYTATSAVLGRPVTAEDLAEQAVTGGVLSGVMAPRLPAGGTRVAPGATTLGVEAPPTARAVTPAAEEGMTSEFREQAHRQALAMLGLSPKQIGTEIARLRPRQPQEAQADPIRQALTQDAPSFRRQPGQRAGIPEPTTRRPSETGALEELGDFFGEMARGEQATTRGNQAIDPDLMSAYNKLGTDDPAEISQLLRDADKRFKKSATLQERASALEAFEKARMLTVAEQQALSRVIPGRTFAPVREGYQGQSGETYSRSIADIPLSEANPQLDRNLRDLMDFFEEAKAQDMPRPKIVEDAAQRLKETLAGQRAGSGGQAVVDVAIVAGWKAYRAGVDFATWAKEVIESVGEQVRPHLRKVWDRMQADVRQVGVEARTLRRVNIPPDIRAKAIADDPTNDTKVSVASLGLKSKFPPQPASGAKLRDIEVNVEDITLGRDDLSKGRMNQVETVLTSEGFKAHGGKVDAVSVVPDPNAPGKWVVFGDGNHRVALLQLAGVRAKIPVKAWLPQSALKQFLAEETGSAKLGLGLPEMAAKRGRAAETVGGLQTVAQLGNPRFVIRNVLQHVVYGKQERAATRIAAALDWVYSASTGKGRQITAPRGSDLASYVRNWGKAIDAYKRGEPLPGKPNADYITADGSRLDKAVGKVMTWINEIPDSAAWTTRFEQSLQSIVEASKKSGGTLDVNAAVDQAWMEANRAALRDQNFASTAMLKIKQGLNSLSKPLFGTDKFGVGDFVLKYAQTPGALLKRGLERSPLGLFQVAKEASTPGPFRRRNTLLALSRVSEGVATGMGLGAALGAAGVLAGPEEEGRTSQAFEREGGVRGYSFNASALRRLLTGESTEMREGDTLYSIDWLQPWAMNLSAGAALYNLHKRGKLGAGSAAGATGEAVYNSLAKTLDVMGDQSVLKNLSRYMKRATGDSFSEQVGNFAKEIGLDAPSSFVPSMARQFRQALDPHERDTRADDRDTVRGLARQAANRAMAQLPGVSERFPTRTSLLTGQPRKTAVGEMSAAERLISSFLSPSNVSTYKPNSVGQEISRLNRAGEKVAISLPRWDKQIPLNLQRDRETKFALNFVVRSRELLTNLRYKAASDDVKAEAFERLGRNLRENAVKMKPLRPISEIIESASASAALNK